MGQLMVRSAVSARPIVGFASVVRCLAVLSVAGSVVVGSPGWANGEEHLQRCHAAYQSGAYDVARGFCARAAKDQSLAAESRALAHLYRGLACNCADSLADYDAAVALAPKLAAAYHTRGMTYHQLNRHDEALRDLMMAVKLEPREPATYLWRGSVLWTLARPTEALADFERLTVLTPKSSDAWRLKGEMEARLGRFDRAGKDIDHSLKLNPRNGWTYSSRAWIRTEAGDLKGARADSDAAIRHQPDVPHFQLDRGRIALLSGDPQKAIPDLFQALTRLPPGQDRHYAAIWFSMAILRMGRELEFMPMVRGVVDEVDKPAWPGSMVWLYLTALSKARKQWHMGDGAEAEFVELSRRAAALPNAHVREDRVCEFGFFMGMFHVLHKDPAHGEGLLRQAAERRLYSWCYVGAKVEHVRLLQRQAKGAVR
jgi:tetratricopeptide (TPR) repeat protein